MDAFTYDNRTGRGPGRVLRVLGWLLPGIRKVQRHVTPYAEAWVAHNREALAVPGRRWYVLGDSMSQSVGATAWDRGWVSQLHERLTRSGRDLTVVNLSATGAVLSDVLDQQVPLLDSLLARDEHRDEAVVTVLIGSNDIFNKAHRPHLPGRFEDLLVRLPVGSVVSTLPQPRSAARRANAHIWAAWAYLAAKLNNVGLARKLYDAAIVANPQHAAAWHGWALTVEVEAKAKELAVARLLRDLKLAK